MQSRLCTAFFAATFAVAVSASALAQVESQPPTRMGRPLPFYFDALNFAQVDAFGMSSRIDLYVQVPFDIITFVKKLEGYAGAYTLSVLVNDEDGKRLKEESWTRKVERSSIEGTTNPNYFDLTQRSITVEPGPVIVEIIFEDKESGSEFRTSKKVDARAFDRNQFGISDLMLVSAVEEREGKRTISPHVNPNIAMLPDGFQAFYEVYNPYEMPEVRISYTIKKRGLVVAEKSEQQPVKQGLNTFITRINTQALSVGSYDLELMITLPKDTAKATPLAKATRPFIVEWLSGGTPLSITDLDEAVEQLRYFAKTSDIDFIKEAKDDKDRRRRFEEFWEKNNPVPGAPVNRAMVEYYTRVAYANEHFGHYIAGWRTDRGMVYIIYGAPSAVDRHPLDVESKPYEIWEYYDITRRFIFTDESGFGDYRLLYPIWDDRNRMRN
jgi:GWxTD domain-containing protein